MLDAAEVWGSTYRRTRDGKPDRSADGIHTCPQGAARFTSWLLAELADSFPGFIPADASHGPTPAGRPTTVSGAADRTPSAQLEPDLERLALARPFDEQVHAQLMLALYRTGRQGDALGVCRRLRVVPAGNLGIDLNLRLRDLEVAILRQDPVLDQPALAVRLLAGWISPKPTRLPPIFTWP